MALTFARFAAMTPYESPSRRLEIFAALPETSQREAWHALADVPCPHNARSRARTRLRSDTSRDGEEVAAG